MRTLVLLFAAAMLFAACNSAVYYSDHCGVDEMGWGLNSPVAFEVDVDDTLSDFDFYVDMRVCKDYPYANAFLFLSTTFPDGGYSLDTLECPLADPEGRWLGKSSGRYVDSRYLLKKNVRFPNTGTYRFSIIHGLRDESVKGIKDVGLMVMKHEE